jgi:hypothetical protein
MTTPNHPENGFPDLTLQDRSETPVEPMLDFPSAVHGVRPVVWREGDHVLAPWDSDFLYAGLIQQIKEDQAHIKFGNGEECWVLVTQVQPLVITRGQMVRCRREPDFLYVPAEILDVSGEQIEVLFADGFQWTSTAALLVPNKVMSSAGGPPQAISPLDFARSLRPGARVWAARAGTSLFCGTVTKLNDQDEAFVKFDDGNAGWVKLRQILPLILMVGARVTARRNMGHQWYSGTITQLKDGRVFILFDDGKKESTTPAALVVPFGTYHRWVFR